MARNTTRWTTSQVILVVSGWAAAFLSAPANINSFFEQKTAAWHHLNSALFSYDRYSGQWSSFRDEGEISSNESSGDIGDVQLILVEDRGRFYGEIFSKRIEETLIPWSRVSVEGDVGIFRFSGQAYDAIFNRRRTIAPFHLKPVIVDSGHEQLDALILTSDREYNYALPESVVLFRSKLEMADGSFSPIYLRILQGIVVEPPVDGASTPTDEQSRSKGSASRSGLLHKPQ